MIDRAPDQIVLVGASGHARVVADIIQLSTNFHIAGYLDDLDPARHGAVFNGGRVLGGLEQLASLSAAGVRFAAVAVGDCAARLEIAGRLRPAGFDRPSLVHPRATVARDVAVGPGSVFVAGAVVNPGARIGESVIVNTGASVDHDCEIADGVHIACGAHLAGAVHVGRGAWIGIGAIVKEQVRIGAGTIVGAGALVLHDLPDHVVAYGSPARIVRHVTRQDPVGR
jgi:acetyltransferase EpsM